MSELKVALVTGASRGIGKECALKLASQGYSIVVNYINNEEIAEAVAEEIRAFGVKAMISKFDVSKSAEVNSAIEEIIKEFGRIDVLLNNAGITKDGLFIRMSDEDWEKVIATNLSSAFYVSKPVTRVMMKQRSGSIINMSSIVGIYGNAGQLNYSAAKAGLIGFTKTLAKELASRNITVNAIAPGFIQTDMTHGLETDKIAENIPLKRLGSVNDIAETVLFLADKAPYITGQVIGVDGGLVI